MTNPTGPAMLCASALVLASITGGCLTRQFPHKSRFVVNVERPGAPLAPIGGVLRVARFGATPLFERKGFVYRVGDAEYEEDFYNEFFVPPATLVQRATRAWLANAALFRAVLEPDDAARADWLLQAKIADLYGDTRDPDDPAAVLSIEYTLARTAMPLPEVVFHKLYSVREPLETRAQDALIGAWGRALERVLAELEIDLHAHVAADGAARAER